MLPPLHADQTAHDLIVVCLVLCAVAIAALFADPWEGPQ